MSERKRGQHKEGCVCVFCQRRRGSNLVAQVAKEPSEAKGLPQNVKIKDEFDRKLDYFHYSLDPKVKSVWEYDDTVSPLHVPQDIKDRYPGLDWHWVSEFKLKTKGRGYNDWELFKDKSYPEGVRRGNDLRLAAMPKERAESYRRAVSERSSRVLRNFQEGAAEDLESRATGVRDIQMLGPDDVIKDKETGKERSIEGLSIGRRPAVDKGGGYQRGMSAEAVREIVTKRLEARKKNKVYQFMK